MAFALARGVSVPIRSSHDAQGERPGNWSPQEEVLLKGIDQECSRVYVAFVLARGGPVPTRSSHVSLGLLVMIWSPHEEFQIRNRRFSPQEQIRSVLAFHSIAMEIEGLL